MTSQASVILFEGAGVGGWVKSFMVPGACIFSGFPGMLNRARDCGWYCIVMVIGGSLVWKDHHQNFGSTALEKQLSVEFQF